MSVMPTVFGLSSAALLGVPVLGVASVMKSADNGLQYTIHETTLQALYVPFPASEKARVRALLEAVVKPCAYGVGGLVLALLAARLGTRGLGALTLGVVIGWLAVVPLVRRRYQRALEGTLSARGDLALDAEFVLDAQGRELLLRVAESAEPRQALAALEQLEGDDSPRLVPALERLLREGNASIRRAAYAFVATMPDAPPSLAARGLADRDDETRAQAANAYARLAGDGCVEALLPLVDDPASEVRTASLAGLLRDGGVEGSIAAGARLAQLLASPGRDERLEAARVLGALGPGAYRPVARLLDDPDPNVRRAALRASASVVDPRLAPRLCELLADPACRNRARVALGAIGDRIVPLLVERLKDPSTPRAARLELPRVLRSIDSLKSYEGLRSFVDDTDGHVRLRVYAALSKLRTSLGLHRERADWLEPQLRRELVEGLAILAGWEAVRDRCATPLLAEQMQLYEARLVRRVLRLLELRYDPGPMRLLRQTIEDPKRRTNALETLDNVVGSAVRSIVMPLFDDAPARERLASVGGGEPLGADAFLRNRAASPNPFTVLLLLDAVSAHREPIAAELAPRAATHPDPLVREAAVLCLARAEAAARTARADAVAQLLADPDPIVARLARSELRDHAPTTKETIVRSTVEKIVILKTTPVFEKIPSEDLAALARVSTEERYADGERIFAEGDHGDSLYVVIRGKVRITKRGEPIATLGAGEAFGEMAVLDAAPRSGDATCEGDTEVLRMGSEEFYEILHEQVELAEGIIRMLVRRLRGAVATSTEETDRVSLIVH
jgi:HEAT repeat protein